MKHIRKSSLCDPLLVISLFFCSVQHEYLGYISKKTQKRQSAVITLSDRNAEKIKEIETKKAEMLHKFDNQKQGFHSSNYYVE